MILSSISSYIAKSSIANILSKMGWKGPRRLGGVGEVSDEGEQSSARKDATCDSA
jgi:hypothetical protein